MEINILGERYEVVIETEDVNPKLKDADGICEVYSKKLILDLSYTKDPDCFDNITEYVHKVLRHEAFHAFFAEMGIKGWFQDEELVDMLAMQYPKIRKIMDECDSLKLEGVNASKEG